MSRINKILQNVQWLDFRSEFAFVLKFEILFSFSSYIYETENDFKRKETKWIISKNLFLFVDWAKKTNKFLKTRTGGETSSI